jgi:hypothetical protein
MNNLLVNQKIKKESIITSSEYQKIENLNEFLLYCDNILEGITLLNTLTLSNDLLSFKSIVYEPIDQPIYIFSDDNNRKYAIKICGAFDKWNLPEDVNQIKSFIDLPDYIFYSLRNKKSILAGENTETASVGNSQWQREGRKLAAAKIGVPFIYQTFYSGKDESLGTIREPNSLQVFNHILYSARYKTPSLIAYFENNFEGSKTRNRTPEDSQDLFSKYIKSIIICDVDDSYISIKQNFEKEFFNHMISYIKEGKYKTNSGKIGEKARLELDFPILNEDVFRGITEKTTDFINELINYIYLQPNQFAKKYPIADIDSSKLLNWTSYNTKNNIKDLLTYLISIGKPAKSYINGSSKVGIASVVDASNYLTKKFPNNKNNIIEKIHNNFSEVIIMPLRIHKKSNGILTFSPDPESGEIVAFGELFGYDIEGNKKRPVIGYCIVDTPTNFSFSTKQGTKLYKAIANYVDILILNNNEVITNYNLLYTPTKYSPVSIQKTTPNGTTEEMAVVSTYLNQSTIKSNWELCFIHTHHSSWQQLVIFDGSKYQQQKNNRVSTKVDLIMQQQNQFMIAEGKDHYNAILNDEKIKLSMENASDTIDKIYKTTNIKFNAFLYNLPTTPSKNPEYYVDCEEKTVAGGIKLGHFNSISNSDNFVVIIVYSDSNNKTRFRLVYSPKFDAILKNKLDAEFK